MVTDGVADNAVIDDAVVRSAVAGPLAGVRVVDLTRFVSGPYATMVLASLGADVIKIEGLPHGDPYRAQGTAFVEGRSLLFCGLNTGKRSLALDLSSESGREVLEHLLATCDVVIENARPGSMSRWGLDCGQVLARYPTIVYASLSGYGQVGPDASRGGFDLILQAETGVMSVTGDTTSGPVKVGAPVMDVGSGMCAVAGILAGLLQRSRSGLGGPVSTSLFEFGLGAFTSTAATMLHTGEVPPRLGSHSPTFAPYGAFSTRRGEIVLAGTGTESLWPKLCDVLGTQSAIEDARFATNAHRVLHRDELTTVIEAALQSRDADEWVTLLDAAGVPATVVRDPVAALRSEQATALGMVQPFTTAGVPYETVRTPFTMGGASSYPRPAPELGEHTRELLEELGFDAVSIDGLVADGIVLDGPVTQAVS